MERNLEKRKSTDMQKMPSNHRVLLDIFLQQSRQDVGSLLWGSSFWTHLTFSCQTETVSVVLSSSWGDVSQTSSPHCETWNWKLFILLLVYKSTPFLKAIFKLKRSPYMPWHTIVLQRRYILISLSEVCEDCQTTVGSTKIVYCGVARKNIPTKGMDPKYIHLSINR